MKLSSCHPESISPLVVGTSATLLQCQKSWAPFLVSTSLDVAAVGPIPHPIREQTDAPTPFTLSFRNACQKFFCAKMLIKNAVLKQQMNFIGGIQCTLS